MVHISWETGQQAERRLLKVISAADFKPYADSFAFEEFSHADFRVKARLDALCLVRDEDHWSQLIPCCDGSRELFGVFSFHFDGCQDNSGFVGWLANHLKAKFGTGVFVVCGQNTRRDGIFDYWGYPVELADSVVAEVRKLIQTGRNL